MRKRVLRRKILFLLICVSVVFVFIFLKEIVIKKKEYIIKFGQREVIPSEVKKILIWTPFFSESVLNDHKSCLAKCDAKCDVTENKNDVSSADAVSFHLVDIWPNNWDIGTKEIVDLPTYRKPEQVWVLWNGEPPVHLFGSLRVLNGLFNWTMFYRYDSTVWWPYGAAEKMNENETVLASREMKERNVFREKTGNIAGRISNCRDMGRRYTLVHGLQKYLSLHMYGKCYDNPCGNVSNWMDPGCDELLRKYKFYLAFENSQCTDYVTEKYWGSLQRDQIPVVNWKGVNINIPIPGSYINIFDFKSIKDAAKYIKRVSDNETLYNSYFHWKLQYKIDTTCPACHLCRALHDKSRPAQVYTNLEGWVQDDICQQVSKSSFEWKEMAWKAFWKFGI